MDMLGKMATGFVFVLGVTALIAVVMAVPTMFLWNWIVPGAIGGGTINYFQAWGLLVLVAIIVKCTQTQIEFKG